MIICQPQRKSYIDKDSSPIGKHMKAILDRTLYLDLLLHNRKEIYCRIKQVMHENGLLDRCEIDPKYYDLMRPYLVNTTNSSTIQVLDGFLYNLIYAGDSFQAGKDCGNFMTWHYSIRALASVVLADSSLMSQTSRMIDSCIIYNIYYDGSSYVFYWRDALHYHVYNMQGWINIALQAPQVLSSLALELIEAGCNFLIPYYSGQIIHIEFVKYCLFDKHRLSIRELLVDLHQHNHLWRKEMDRCIVE